MTGPGCRGNILCHGQLQLLNLLLQGRLQVALIHRVLHEERLEDERHEDTGGKTGSDASSVTDCRWFTFLLSLSHSVFVSCSSASSLDDDDDDHDVEDDEEEPG